jgi:hypothetical protein
VSYRKNKFILALFHTFAYLKVEQNSGGAYLPVAVKSRSEEIVYLQLDSRLSVDQLEDVRFIHPH